MVEQNLLDSPMDEPKPAGRIVNLLLLEMRRAATRQKFWRPPLTNASAAKTKGNEGDGGCVSEAPKLITIAEASRQVVSPVPPVPNLRPHFPFTIEVGERLKLISWLRSVQRYEIVHILENLPDNGLGKRESNKYEKELKGLVSEFGFELTVKAVLNAGGDPNGGGGVLLRSAFLRRRIGHVGSLLAAGADPNVFNTFEIRNARLDGYGSMADRIESASQSPSRDSISRQLSGPTA